MAIARALVKMPRVLLLDEPLSNLDARLRLQTREEIVKIQKKTGITTLFVTHDQEEAMSISDRIVVMKEGVLMQEGAPQQVYDDPHSLFVAKFLGTPPINVLEGRVEQGRLFLGEQDVLPVAGGRKAPSPWASGPRASSPGRTAPSAAACSGWRVLGPGHQRGVHPPRLQGATLRPLSARRRAWTAAVLSPPSPCG